MSSKTERVCPICGKTYIAKIGRLKLGKQTTCSRECSYILRGKQKETRVECICQRCGKAFYAVPSAIKKGRGIYCSRKCQYPPQHRTCLHCGKVFRYSPSANAIFCSKRCTYDSQRRAELARQNAEAQWANEDLRQKTLEGIKRRSQSPEWRANMYFQPGEKNPAYKDGNGRRFRDPDLSHYRKWRRAVLKRDNFTCQQCGVRGERMTAHHIKPWIDFPDLRYEVANGLTLCVPCHNSIHGWTVIPTTKTCLCCGKEFRPHKNEQKYCSRPCYFKHYFQ